MSSTTASTPGAPAAPYRTWLLPAILVADPNTDVQDGPAWRSVRDWIVDSIGFVLAIGIGLLVFGLDTPGRPVSDAEFLIDAALAVPACIALWWRRRFPVILALAAAPIGLFSLLSAGMAAVALFTVAVHRRFVVVVAVAAVHLLWYLPYPVLHTDPELTYWQSVVWGVLFMAAIVAWGMFVRARRQLVLSLRDRAHRAETEQALRVAQARHFERTRIAREMHDVLAHRISLLSLHAGALEFRPDAPAEEVARAAAVIRESAHQALQDLRAVIGILREESAAAHPERPQPTLTDVPALIDESRLAGTHVNSDIRVAEPEVAPESVGRTAYRVVQEGLTNARKHAPGTTVDVCVDGTPSQGITI